jgi:hypothetical protein
MIRNYEKKPCTCWMKIESCYCTTAHRYIVRNQDKEDQSVWDDVDEAVKDGREHLVKFRIFDAYQHKYIIRYGE